MNEIGLFGNIVWGVREFEGQPVLTASVDGVLHYETAGFCRLTKHTNPSKAVRDLVDPSQVKKLDITPAQAALTEVRVALPAVTPGPNPMRNFITREGANRLVLDSRVPGSQRLKNWIADDVMTSIEDNGSYVAPGASLPVMPDFSTLDSTALAYLGQVGQALAHTSEKLLAVQAENAKLQVKAQAFDDWINGKGCYLIGTVAKMLHLGPKMLWDFLYDEKILINSPKSKRHREPYSGKPSTAWFEVKPVDPEKANGHATKTTYLSPYGAEQLRLLLIKRGHLPPQQLALLGGIS